ncbi:MAG: hypothetical protein NTV54_03180 [Ignavibacteriales bacterium]|nr:hypothetical protein [Ignavibacteriales bacterium]
MKMLCHAILFLFCGPALSTADSATPENKYVRYTAAVSDSVCSPGKHILLTFLLSPVDGVHVNADPSPEFSFAAQQSVATSDTLGFAIDSGTGHLDPTRPLTFGFRVPPSTPPGILHLRGSLSYFFCSDEKGWCNHFNQPVTIQIHVR